MSKKDLQKVWWIRREKNYFDNYKIKCLEQEKNGYIYFNLYEKMCCESIPYQGELRYSENQKYDEKLLSAVANIPLKHVQNGLKVLKNLELIDYLQDGTIVIPEVIENCFHESYQTMRKRNSSRNNEGGNFYPESTADLPQNYQGSTPNLPKTYPIVNIYDDDNNKYNNFLIIIIKNINIKSHYERLKEAYKDSDYPEQVLRLTAYALNVLAIDPASDDAYRCYLKACDVLDNEEVMNKEAYLITSMKNGGLMSG